MKTLFVSLVTFNNSLDQLNSLLKSLNSQSSPWKMGVIDNSPADALKAFFSRYQNVDYLHCPENLGFAKGHNLAVRKWANDSDFILIVNPDLYFDEDIFGYLIQFMERNKNVALAIPKVLNPDGSIQYVNKKLPTPFDLFCRRFFKRITPHWGFLQRIEARYELRDLYDEPAFYCPYISGCFMFVRTRVFLQEGGFDSNIFMYLEDTDLTRRIARKYDSIVLTQIHVFHTWARGSHKSLNLTLINIKSAFYYFRKWGWFYDPERNELNKRINTSLNLLLPTKNDSSTLGQRL